MKILLIEDNPSDALLIKIELERNDAFLEFTCVTDRAGFLDVINYPFDVILSDYVLYQFDALDALRVLHEHDSAIPLIVITGAVRRDDVERACLQAGAKGFILKSELETLIPAIKKALSMTH